MTKQFRSIGDAEIDCNDVVVSASGDYVSIFHHSGEGASFTVEAARALVDFLNRALPNEPSLEPTGDSSRIAVTADIPNLGGVLDEVPTCPACGISHLSATSARQTSKVISSSASTSGPSAMTAMRRSGLPAPNAMCGR